MHARHGLARARSYGSVRLLAGKRGRRERVETRPTLMGKKQTGDRVMRVAREEARRVERPRWTGVVFYTDRDLRAMVAMPMMATMPPATM